MENEMVEWMLTTVSRQSLNRKTQLNIQTLN